MATCKDCLSHDICEEHRKLMFTIDNQYELIYQEAVEVSCMHFKNIADVVEVVRCKDCAHYIEIEGFDYSGHKARVCAWHTAYKGENEYCSDGTRRAKE